MTYGWYANGKQTMTDIFDRITFTSNIMAGRACIRGLPITVALLVNLVANGMSTEDILRKNLDIEAEDIRQALSDAAALANEEIHPFTPTTACRYSRLLQVLRESRAALD
jgi:uncharacterized protein (DUF433 family)